MNKQPYYRLSSTSIENFLLTTIMSRTHSIIKDYINGIIKVSISLDDE